MGLTITRSHYSATYGRGLRLTGMNKTKIALTLGLAALGLVQAAAAAPKPPKPGPGSTLSIAAKPSPVVFGRTSVISGKLVGTNVSGQTVTLRSDPYPYDKFANAGTAITSATGDYSFAQKPTVNTRYQARVGSLQSAVITVPVRPAVSLRLSDYTPKSGQRVRFAGRVCPQHDGSVLAIQRRSAGKYRTVRRTTLRDIPGSSCSSYRKTFRVHRDGRFRAVIGAHADHATGLSRSRVANAHS
jgi:hypothetical protein